MLNDLEGVLKLPLPDDPLLGGVTLLEGCVLLFGVIVRVGAVDLFGVAGCVLVGLGAV